jgi:hypothetical protein
MHLLKQPFPYFTFGNANNEPNDYVLYSPLISDLDSVVPATPITAEFNRDHYKDIDTPVATGSGQVLQRRGKFFHAFDADAPIIDPAKGVSVCDVRDNYAERGIELSNAASWAGTAPVNRTAVSTAFRTYEAGSTVIKSEPTGFYITGGPTSSATIVSSGATSTGNPAVDTQCYVQICARKRSVNAGGFLAVYWEYKDDTNVLIGYVDLNNEIITTDNGVADDFSLVDLAGGWVIIRFSITSGSSGTSRPQVRIYFTSQDGSLNHNGTEVAGTGVMIDWCSIATYSPDDPNKGYADEIYVLDTNVPGDTSVETLDIPDINVLYASQAAFQSEGTVRFDFTPYHDFDAALSANFPLISFYVIGTEPLLKMTENAGQSLLTMNDGTNVLNVGVDRVAGKRIPIRINWSATSGTMEIWAGSSFASGPFDGAIPNWFGPLDLFLGRQNGFDRADGAFMNVKLYDYAW